MAATPNPDNIEPSRAQQGVSFGKGQALSTNVGSAPASGRQSAGTDARGAPSVITLGKNQVVNQRERTLRPARMVGFCCVFFFRLRLRFVVWTGKVNNDNDSSNTTETKNGLLVQGKGRLC